MISAGVIAIVDTPAMPAILMFSLCCTSSGCRNGMLHSSSAASSVHSPAQNGRDRRQILNARHPLTTALSWSIAPGYSASMVLTTSPAVVLMGSGRTRPTSRPPLGHCRMPPMRTGLLVEALHAVEVRRDRQALQGHGAGGGGVSGLLHAGQHRVVHDLAEVAEGERRGGAVLLAGVQIGRASCRE